MSSKSKYTKKIDQLIKAISKELEIEESFILHFITVDLENIYNSKVAIHRLQLNTLRNEFDLLLKRERQLKNSIDETTRQIENTSSGINIFVNKIKEKTKLLEQRKNELETLHKKLDEIEMEIASIENQKKHIEYNSMMKSHSIKEKSDKSFKYIKLYLTLITIVAIIIVSLIILLK